MPVFLCIMIKIACKLPVNHVKKCLVLLWLPSNVTSESVMGKTDYIAAFNKASNLTICQMAQEALLRGIERNDPITHLEYFGIKWRILSFLENSEHKIIFLPQLLNITKEQLCSIDGIGIGYVEVIYGALNRYHEVDKYIQEEETREIKKRENVIYYEQRRRTKWQKIGVDE